MQFLIKNCWYRRVLRTTASLVGVKAGAAAEMHKIDEEHIYIDVDIYLSRPTYTDIDLSRPIGHSRKDNAYPSARMLAEGAAPQLAANQSRDCSVDNSRASRLSS